MHGGDESLWDPELTGLVNLKVEAKPVVKQIQLAVTNGRIGVTNGARGREPPAGC